jgi:hypothetical protein
MDVHRAYRGQHESYYSGVGKNRTSDYQKFMPNAQRVFKRVFNTSSRIKYGGKGRREMTNGASPGRGMLVIGGVGGIIWLVGVILRVIQNATVANIGGIILGVGVLLASFAGFGLWQRTKDMMAMLTFVFAMIGGILFLVGGAVDFVSGWGDTIFGVGQVLFAISLIVLGLVVNKLGSQLNTQAILGMDLVFPVVVTSIAGGCAALGATVIVTAPAALLLAVMFFVTK